MFKRLRSRYLAADSVLFNWPIAKDRHVGANRSLLLLLLALSLTVAVAGCRRAAPPSFTPAPAVIELTNDIEDPEELKLYKDLQAQIAEHLAHLTGTPDKPISLDDSVSSDRLRQGFALYSRFCTQCHGTNGDGNGRRCRT